jgi:enoyl-CoA hydratase
MALNRPEQHNRLQPEDLTVLEQHLHAIASDKVVKILQLTAQGKSFCAGFDLRALTSGQSLNNPLQLERVINQLEALPQPTIAVLQGDVHGGGIDLALACDFRLGVQGMQAHMPAAKLGVHYYAHGMRRYVQRLGANAARRLLLAAESFDTAALLRCGFIDQAWPAAQLHDAALELAQRLATTPVHVLQGMKRDIRDIENHHFDEQAINARWQQSLRDIANIHSRKPS